MGPMDMAGPDRRGHRHGRGPQPDVQRVPEGRRAASRTTGPRCTCTAASPRGSATARRTSGSPRPARTPPWPQGVSVENVPDMDVCDGDRRRLQTFYYTNQQSARLMFYHDHAWGITRLNVYAGEAAGYLITDATEQALIGRAAPSPAWPTASRSSSRTGPSSRTRPSSPLQDPTWDTARWGSKGNFWYHHVYMPAQNPGDPSRHERLRPLDVRAVVLAAGHAAVRADRQPVLRPDLQPRRPGHLAVPDRPVLRAGADPGHAEHLGRHGAVQRHADRQRRRLPDGHPGAEVLPPAHPERGQRPLLQLPVVRGRPDHRGPTARSR